MPEIRKVLGWGQCTVNGMNDIVDKSTQLSVEEGQEQTADIEGGSSEGRKKAPDKYILTFKRRLGNANEVEPGYTEEFGDVEVEPENGEAVGVKLKGCSEHIAVGFDTTDGTVATYTYKTKGTKDNRGKLTDVQLT